MSYSKYKKPDKEQSPRIFDNHKIFSPSQSSQSFNSKPLKLRKSNSMTDIPTKIEEVLRIKDERSKARINTLKILKVAEERRVNTGTPKINPKSKEILIEAKRRQKEKEMAEKLANGIIDKDDSFKEHKSLGTELKIPYESLKESLKSRSKLLMPEKEEERVDVSKMSLIERNCYWNQKKDERIETERKSKEIEQMSECTFKPILSPKISAHNSHNSISSMEDLAQKAITLSLSVYSCQKKSSPSENEIKEPKIAIKPYSMDKKQSTNVRVPPPNPPQIKMKKIDNEEKHISEPILTPSYSQLTPVSTKYRHKQGFNYEKLKSNAKPLVRYSSFGS
ncbi:unnamed protein product [Blepharisma stoltei]|uniref:Uncharacterized protein n=1 Tax=Blepharisma stoltei TaxID=1481888 RepID=A0AAU9JKS5_9CILI|nr:unnamed protein product [Blepharisma stoltei]